MDFSFDVSPEVFVPNPAGMNQFLYGPTGEVSTYLRKAGRRIQLAARAQVGKDTGDLAASIFFDIRTVGTMPTLVVGATDDIALIHHEGTRPHAIQARTAQAMRYSSRGRMVYSRAVLHPGTPPNRFLSDNLYLGRM